MPKGLESAIKKTGTGFGPQINYFRLQDGETATVRFLEAGEDISWAYMYQLPPREGRKYGDRVPSLDQQQDGTECPFRDSEKVVKGVIVRGFLNIIWRNAPVYKRDSNGRLIKDSNNKYIQDGTEDRIALWDASKTILEDLAALDAELKGLVLRDMKVRRNGSDLNTRYVIYPTDSATELSKNDKELIANKYDLTPFVTPPSFEEAKEMLGEGGQGNADLERAKNANMFLNN